MFGLGLHVCNFAAVNGVFEVNVHDENGVRRPRLVYKTWSTTKLITTASDNAPPERLRNVIVQLPVDLPETQQLYAPAVAPEETLKVTTSFALMPLLVKVNVTFVAFASSAPFIVI